MTLIDTDILIDVARGVPEAITCLKDIQTSSLPLISVVTHMELLVGCRDKSEVAKLDKFLASFQIIKLNEEISDQAFDLLSVYRLSHGLLIPDSLIAATALVLGVPLISKNQKDYRFVGGLNLLQYP